MIENHVYKDRAIAIEQFYFHQRRKTVKGSFLTFGAKRGGDGYWWVLSRFGWERV